MSSYAPKRYTREMSVVTAMNAGDDPDAHCALIRWCGGRAVGPEDGYEEAVVLADAAFQTVGVGEVAVEPGQWLIEHTSGGYFVMDDSTFRESYVLVGETEPALRRGITIDLVDGKTVRSVVSLSEFQMYARAASGEMIHLSDLSVRCDQVRFVREVRA